MRIYMGNYEEEIFHANLNCGQIAKALGHEWEECFTFFLNACKLQTIGKRAEPLIEIANYYIEQDKYSLAFSYCKEACDLTYPFHCLLFVNKQCYDYDRHVIMCKIVDKLGEKATKEQLEYGKKSADVCLNFTPYRAPSVDEKNGKNNEYKNMMLVFNERLLKK